MVMNLQNWTEKELSGFDFSFALFLSIRMGFDHRFASDMLNIEVNHRRTEVWLLEAPEQVCPGPSFAWGGF